MYDLGEYELKDFQASWEFVPVGDKMQRVLGARVLIRPVSHSTLDHWLTVTDKETVQRFRERWITWLNVDDVEKTYPIVYLGVAM